MKRIILILSVIFIVAGTTVVFHLTQTYDKVFIRGERYFKQSRYRMALPYLLSAFNRNPEDPRPAHYLLKIYEHLGDTTNVKNVLETLVEQFPNEPDYRRYLADIYYRLADYPEAEKNYRRYLQMRSDPVTRAKLAEILIWQKKHDEGIAELEQVIETFPSDHKHKELLADVYSWVGQHKKSEKLYRELLTSNIPNKKDIVLKLADVLRYMGKNEEALKLYDTYIEE